MNASLNPIYYNCEAVLILTYPEIAIEPERLESFLAMRTRSLLMKGNSPGTAFVTEFVSGRRRYLCRTFTLDASSPLATPSATIAVLLERKQQRSVNGRRIAAQYHLTERERETVELLVYGLTSKEIAHRMKISPSTVKAFLRMAMVKMGTTTRSGLVGRILEAHLARD